MGKDLTKISEIAEIAVAAVRGNILFYPSHPDDAPEASPEHKAAHRDIVGIHYNGSLLDRQTISTFGEKATIANVELIYKTHTANCDQCAIALKHEVDKQKDSGVYVYVVALYAANQRGGHTFNIVSSKPIQNFASLDWLKHAVIADAWTKDKSCQVFPATQWRDKLKTWTYASKSGGPEILDFSESTGKMSLVLSANIRTNMIGFFNVALVALEEAYKRIPDTLHGLSTGQAKTQLRTLITHYKELCTKILTKDKISEGDIQRFNAINQVVHSSFCDWQQPIRFPKTTAASTFRLLSSIFRQSPAAVKLQQQLDDSYAQSILDEYARLRPTSGYLPPDFVHLTFDEAGYIATEKDPSIIAPFAAHYDTNADFTHSTGRVPQGGIEMGYTHQAAEGGDTDPDSEQVTRCGM
jgi:hypothetical protein